MIGSAILGVWTLAGCKAVQTTAEIPGRTARAISGQQPAKVVDPIEVQQTLLQFSNEFATRMTVGINLLKHEPEQRPVDPVDALNWKILINSQVLAIASGANPVAGLLDMAVMVTLMRPAIEDLAVTRGFGDSAASIIESCRTSEQRIWRFIDEILAPEQEKALRQAIEEWRRDNPDSDNVIGVRAVGFLSELSRTEKGGLGIGASLKSLISLDPLASLDPTVREITQSRLFAERALFAAQKMPTLMRWQMELLSIESTRLPAVEQLVANTTGISASVDRFARVAELLPEQISAEREEILNALEAQEQQLTPLVNEVRQTLVAGDGMSVSLNQTILSLDALMKRFGVGEPPPPGASGTSAGEPGAGDTPSEPFRILDYAEVATRLEAAARQLTELLQTFDQTLGSPNMNQLAAEVAPIVEQAQAGGREVVDRAFSRGLLLILAVFAAALAYRLISHRLLAPKPGRSDPA